MRGQRIVNKKLRFTLNLIQEFYYKTDVLYKY